MTDEDDDELAEDLTELRSFLAEGCTCEECGKLAKLFAVIDKQAEALELMDLPLSDWPASAIEIRFTTIQHRLQRERADAQRTITALQHQLMMASTQTAAAVKHATKIESQKLPEPVVIDGVTYLFVGSEQDHVRKQWQLEVLRKAEKKIEAAAQKASVHFKTMRGDPHEITEAGGIAEGLREAADEVRGLMDKVRKGESLDE